MSSYAIIAAIAEENFKHYVMVCEYLKLDPREVHELKVIEERASIFESFAKQYEHLKEYRTAIKDVKWFVKNYKELIGLSYRFPNRCVRLHKKENLIVLPETVQDEYLPATLTNYNYEYYQKKSRKVVLISCGIVFVVAIIVILCIVFFT